VFIVSKWTPTKSRPISYAVISHNKQNMLHYKGSNSAWSLNQSFKYKVRVHYWSGTSAECPDGFVTHGQSCYHFSHDQETWLDAVVSVQEYIIQSKKDKPLNKTLVVFVYIYSGTPLNQNLGKPEPLYSGNRTSFLLFLNDFNTILPL